MNSIESLKKNIENLMSNLTQGILNSEVISELESLYHSIDTAKEKLAELNDSIVSREEKNKEVAEDIKAKSAELTRLVNSIGDIKSAQADLLAREGALQADKELLESDREMFLSELESMKKEAKELEPIIEKVRSKKNEFDKLDGIIAGMILEHSEMVKGITELKKEEFVLGGKIDSHNKAIKLCESDISKLMNTRKSLNEELDLIKQELKSFDSKKSELDSVLDELKSSKKELQLVKDEFNEKRKALDTELVDIKSEIKSEMKLLENIKKEKDEEMKKIIPTISDFDKREKDLDRKEKDLAIIEKRLKKLYGQHGASFKV